MTTTAEIAIPQSAEDIAPSWVQQVLQKDFPGITITDVDVKGSISEGEGFMSNIIAFDAVGTRNGTSQRYSLVAKLTDFQRPLTIMKEWPKEYHINIEKIETQFYSDAVPDLLSVAIPSTEREPTSANEKDENKAPDDSFFSPKCYFAATDPSSMMSVRVMENLKTQGFSIKANGQPLSREEMMPIVAALAQLHGLSHRLELRSGKPLPETYGWIVTRSDITSVMNIMTNQHQTFVKDFAAAFPDQTDLVASLRKLDLRAILKDDSRLKVLCHADCYANNIMIKHNGDVPADAKLVDWQTTMYAVPTYDLTILFLCNTSWDVFHNDRDAILAHYHHKLQETLGPDVPSGLQSYTLEQLKADFKADCLHGLIYRFTRATPPSPDLVQMIQEIKEWGLI
ncbi:uncharacterized protein LOC118431040 isoform X2 [Branchiostoma floridae]|uniref:Uncharacterized protein LOC118431040 isoform X2 n=1 Tax=Branchiostoma floridae TaxID=7739 RepID=A0A9J7NCN3_BRAFL|nr:uncharacterized protein LOC118431040 isoform X2 [Branchiostoma floridae]